LLKFLLSREFDGEFGSFHIGRCEGNPAFVVFFDHPPDYIHADTGSGLRGRLGGEEGGENLTPLFIAYSDTVIRNLNIMTDRLLE